jgi:hypothetical protein
MIGFLRRCANADSRVRPPATGLRRFPRTPQGYSGGMKIGLGVARSSTMSRDHTARLAVAASGEPHR